MKKITFTFFTLCMLALHTVLPAQTTTWGLVLEEPLFTYRIKDFGFRDGFAYATSEYSSIYRRLFKSYNGGQTWAVSDITAQPSGSGYASLTQVHFFDSLNAMYRYNVAGFYQVFKTTDGGSTFTLLSDTVFADYSPGTISDIRVVTEDFWYGVVRTYKNSTSEVVDLVYATTDGGLTWTDLTPNILAAGGQMVVGISFPTPTVGYISTSNKGVFLKTTDGGATWSNVNSTVGNVSSGIGGGRLFFLDNDHGYYARMVGSFDQFDTLYYTSNGGTTFTHTGLTFNNVWKDYVGNDPNYNEGLDRITSMDFLDVDNGIITCHFNSDLDIIIRTRDGGATWVQDSLIDSVPGIGYGSNHTYNVQMVNENSAFANFNGMLIGFGDGVPGSSGSLAVQNDQFESLNVFPNPLQYGDLHIAMDGTYHVQLYDLQGKLLMEKNELNGTSSLDLANVGAGLYTLMIFQHNNTTSRKIVIR